MTRYCFVIIIIIIIIIISNMPAGGAIYFEIMEINISRDKVK